MKNTYKKKNVFKLKIQSIFAFNIVPRETHF